MQSDCLQDNPLGDPSLREIAVWTPAGFEDSDALPTILVLPAFTSTGAAYLARGWRKPSLPERLDVLLKNGMQPVRVVMPDVVTAVGGSQYLNSPGIGQYATWVAEELPAFLAEQFVAGERWGLTGSSSGGYGALTLAMSYPGRFFAIAAHSPDAAFEVCYPPDFPVAVEVLRDAGGLSAWWGDFRNRVSLKNSDHAVLGLVGMSCAYSPNVGRSPLPCTLPVDLDTGAIRSEVFETWLDHDPVRLLPRNRSAIQSLGGLYLDVGRRDEFRLQVGARLLAKSLDEMGVNFEFAQHDGGHFGLKARLDLSVPWLAACLADQSGS